MNVKLLQAFEAFERDRPLLVREHTGRWAGYWGQQRIGPFDNAVQVYAAAASGNVPEGEFLVRHIDATPESETIECRFVNLQGEFV